jgi:hypothetical protein
MIRPLLAIPLVAATVPPTPKSGQCQFRQGIAIGCLSPGDDDGSLAVEMYRQFGSSRAELGRSNIKALINEAGCTPFVDLPGSHREIHYIGKRQVPTCEGWVEVRFVTVKTNIGALSMMIAGPYFDSPCSHDKPGGSGADGTN